MFYGSANAFHILVEQGLYHRFTTISAVTTIIFDDMATIMLETLFLNGC